MSRERLSLKEVWGMGGRRGAKHDGWKEGKVEISWHSSGGSYTGVGPGSGQRRTVAMQTRRPAREVATRLD